jgi:hypothetical protein
MEVTLSARPWLRLAKRISAAAVLFASLLLRLLAILFDLEIRLINWLIKKRREHRFRQTRALHRRSRLDEVPIEVEATGAEHVSG